MQQATIQVQFVNQPKTATGPGSVKDSNGKYWKVWSPKKQGDPSLDDFVAGGTYSITYKPGTYQGKPDDTITSVTQTAGAVAPKTNGHTIAPRQSTSPTDAERMFTCSLLNAFIQAGKVELSPDEVEGATLMLRGIWQNTFGADA